MCTLSKACPSALCEEGAVLLAVRTDQTHIAYVAPPVKITAEFVDRERERGRPEARFRFSSPCREGACPQWTGDRCGAVDLAIGKAVPVGTPAPKTLPACSIRRTCR